MRAPLLSRMLFTFLGLFLAVAAHIADMVEPTHIYNPNWPPHAKFHGGQTLAMSIAIGAATIVFAWRRGDDRRTNIWAALAFALLYWVTQAAAICYPGTAFFDPEFARVAPLGIPVQLWLGSVMSALAVLAAWLALRKTARWS